MNNKVFHIQNHAKTLRYGLRNEFIYEDHHPLDAPEYLLKGSMMHVKAQSKYFDDFVATEYCYRETLGDFGIW
jgi:hypothetical protein